MTSDGVCTAFTYEWSVGSGKLVGFVPYANVTIVVDVPPDTFVEAGTVEWTLPGPGVYTITCTARSLGYPDTTTTITVPHSIYNHVSLNIKAYPEGYHWPENVPDSDLSADVEVHYRLDGSWDTTTFLTPLSLSVDKNQSVMVKVVEPYPQGYVFGPNSAWDIYGTGMIQGKASIELYEDVDKTLVAYLEHGGSITTQTTAAEMNYATATTYPVTTTRTPTEPATTRAEALAFDWPILLLSIVYNIPPELKNTSLFVRMGKLFVVPQRFMFA